MIDYLVDSVNHSGDLRDGLPPIGGLPPPDPDAVYRWDLQVYHDLVNDYIAEPAHDYSLEVYLAIILFLVAVLVAAYLLERFAPQAPTREVEVGDAMVRVDEELLEERRVGYQ